VVAVTTLVFAFWPELPCAMWEGTFSYCKINLISQKQFDMVMTFEVHI